MIEEEVREVFRLTTVDVGDVEAVVPLWGEAESGVASLRGSVEWGSKDVAGDGDDVTEVGVETGTEDEGEMVWSGGLVMASGDER